MRGKKGQTKENEKRIQKPKRNIIKKRLEEPKLNSLDPTIHLK